MNKRSSFFACAAVVGMSVVGASMHGCYWDDALYKKYAEGSHLVTCRGVCMKDNKPIANSISKENCRGDNTQWISGKSENGGTCVVRTRRGCEAIAKEFEDEEVRWVEYDYQALQLAGDFQRRGRRRVHGCGEKGNRRIFSCGDVSAIGAFV